jgi:dihydrofolate reductase
LSNSRSVPDRSISLIVAASKNNVIGVAGQLPWHLSDDLKRFKVLTMNKPIVMGRKTFESIGRALPGRQNVVITTQSDYAAPGCEVVASPEAAVAATPVGSEIMIIGGGEIYRLFLPRAVRIYLTRVDVVVDGDTFFPDLRSQVWRESAREEFSANDRNDHDFAVITYDRLAPG